MINIKVKGLDTAIKGIRDAEKRVVKVVSDELNAFGLDTVRDAKNLAPANEGYLKQHIGHVMEGSLKVLITSGADYSAYVEFGTRKFAEQYVSGLPATWQEFARKYKGKGDGTFEELVERIYEWVRKKKIGATYDIKTRRRVRQGRQSAKTTDEATAYAIAKMIVINGIKAQPFLVPAVDKNRIELIKHLKQAFK